MSKIKHAAIAYFIFDFLFFRAALICLSSYAPRVLLILTPQQARDLGYRCYENYLMHRLQESFVLLRQV